MAKSKVGVNVLSIAICTAVVSAAAIFAGCGEKEPAPEKAEQA